MPTATDHEARRRLALCRLKGLLTYSGPDPAMQERSITALAHVCGYRVDEPHRQIIRHQNLTQFGDRNDDLTLAPRGCGKTVIGGAVRDIAYLIRNFDACIGIFSKTQSAAEDMLGSVVEILRTNALLIELFGPFFSDSSRSRIGRYGSSQATVLQRSDSTIKDPTFLAMGVGGQAANRHFDYWSLDDMVTERNSRTQRERRNLWSWHGSTFLGTVKPGAKGHRLGTRYYPGDAYEVLEDGGADQAHGVLHGAVLKIRAIVEDPETGEERSFYPEVFPLAELQRRRRYDKFQFGAQMQQDATAGEGMMFNYAKYRWWGGDEGVPPETHLAKFQYSDLAAKRTEAGDFFACVTIGVAVVDSHPRIYVLDLVRERAGTAEQRDLARNAYDLHHPVAAGIEAVAMQAGFAQELAEGTLLPFVPVQVLVDKTLNAQPVSILVDNGHVYFPLPESPAGQRCAPLMAELAMFPHQSVEDHDDTVDAFVGAVKLAMGSSWGQWGTEKGLAAGTWESLTL